MSDPLDGTPNAATPPVPPVTPPITPPPVVPPVAPPVAPPVVPPTVSPVSNGVPAGSGYGAPAGSGDGFVAGSGYGAPANGQGAPTKKTLSLIGMIAGIVGIVGSAVGFIPFVGSIMGVLIPIAAVVLGFLGRSREGAGARGLWLTAIITGFVGIAIMVIFVIFYAVLFSSPEFRNQMDQMPRNY